MAVQGGLFSQGRTGESGMLRPGLDADITTVSTEPPRMTMVRGKILYENGKFSTIDMDRLRQRIEAIVKRF